ncbi:MAG TPA: hypothetical protein VLH19_04935 [Patescibacteria group bacterium]|nr:hypothetical protein [Patescibacteria group bacterium]
MFATPILLLTFNRPDYVERQIQLLSAIAPKRLYIACDGPRNNEDLEIQNRIHILVSNIDWKCSVFTLYRKKNLGCRVAVSSAIDWFFKNEEQGIILEDDCIADVTFFPFCEQMLRRYRKDKKIMHVSGMSPVHIESKNSYVFSSHPLCWGWATWRRAWKKYDVNMKTWPDRASSYVGQKYWIDLFQKMYEKKIDTWDYQWIYSVFENHGLSIILAVNLVTNIGFDSRATHTKFFLSPNSYQLSSSMLFPLRHPTSVASNTYMDKLIQTSFEKHIFLKLLHGIVLAIIRL